jgi:hypothetical protein
MQATTSALEDMQPSKEPDERRSIGGRHPVGQPAYNVHNAAAGGSSAHSYLAIYEIDADDLTDRVKELRARSGAGQTHTSDSLQTDPPPVVTIYDLLEQQVTARAVGARRRSAACGHRRNGR